MDPTERPWKDLAADIERLGGRGDARARIAIVSYEFVGVVRNGGIGTASTELGLALARDGHEVDLIFTGAGDVRDEAEFERWRRHYRERGLRLDRVKALADLSRDSVIHSAGHSLAVYRLLATRDAERPYDAIHFVESLGHGFYALQAKRNGLAFERATTVVCTHSPRRWLAEAHQMPFAHPQELSDEFLENRSLELADVVVSPSGHMLDWLRGRGVRLPERSYVQQYVTYFDRPDGAAATGSPEAGAAPVEELVFFGRLEPRKGIYTFCDALDLLASNDPPPGLRRVTLLGRESVPREVLLERGRAWPWALELRTELDRDAALEYLAAPGRLAVMASTKDNSPNVVYEAIGLDLAFLASRGGGTGELVHPDDFERVTYDPRDAELRELDRANPARLRPAHSGRVLAERLREALARKPRPAGFAVAPDANRETHVAWHRTVAARRPATPAEPAGLPTLIAAPDLPRAMAEAGELVVVIDPGIEYDPRLAAALAAAAAANPDAGFVTTLGGYEAVAPAGVEERVFLPAGGPAAMGLFGNCVGAGVALARRAALERVGVLDDGESAPRGVAELLSRAVLAAERIDVLPEAFYRLPASALNADGSFARAGDLAELLRPYSLMLPPEARDIAACAARFYREEPKLRHAAVEAEHLSAMYAELASSRGVRTIRALRRPATAIRKLLARRRG